MSKLGGRLFFQQKALVPLALGSLAGIHNLGSAILTKS